MPIGKCRSDGHRPVRADGPAAACITKASSVADLEMEFLHKGRPPVVRQGGVSWSRRAAGVADDEEPDDDPRSSHERRDYTDDLLRILASPNVASKEWIVRQYDHEVQGGSVVKPFVGVANDGPSDAAVLRPVLGSRRGVVIACGMNPRYGDFDTYHMAASAIDEAVRNCVAVGADPRRIAILDNFCWGDCERPETLGALVRAALACHDVAVALGTPFISGKDSLNNEFSYTDASGRAADDRDSAVAVDQRDGAGRRRVAVRDDGFQAAGQSCCISSAKRATSWAARTLRW